MSEEQMESLLSALRVGAMEESSGTRGMTPERVDRMAYWWRELEAHRMLAPQVDMLLTAGSWSKGKQSVNFKDRKGLKFQVRFIDTWYRGCNRIANFSDPALGWDFDEDGEVVGKGRLHRLVNVYRRCEKLLTWRRNRVTSQEVLNRLRRGGNPGKGAEDGGRPANRRSAAGEEFLIRTQSGASKPHALPCDHRLGGASGEGISEERSFRGSGMAPRTRADSRTTGSPQGGDEGD